MTALTLAARGLRFYWRTHLSVAIGAAVATAVLVGALAVGDSVRFSLRQMASARLGEVELAVSGDRFFRASLAADLEADLRHGSQVAPVLRLAGSTARPDRAALANRVQVLGVDERFWSLAPRLPSRPHPLNIDLGPSDVAINRALAVQLSASEGDTIVLRAEKPSVLPHDLPLSGEGDSVVLMRRTVRAILPDSEFGRFSLQANQVAPATAFLPLAALQEASGEAGRANVLLVGSTGGPVSPQAATDALRRHWSLADAELELRPAAQETIEFRSRRIFLDDAVARAALARPGATSILTYFVNELRVGDRSTPYSVVTAIHAPPPAPPAATQPASALADALPPLKDDEIAVNTWLADDLQAKVGDRLEMKYFILGPTGRLAERGAAFRVAAIIPMEGLAADRGLLPAFPGLADVKSCRDWRPGMPVDANRIRDKDEQYWDRYRGTPKAFVSLAAGQRMWANRFGSLTAIRWPASVGQADPRGMAILAMRPTGVSPVESPEEQQDRDASATHARTGHATNAETGLAAAIRERIDPAEIGLFFLPVRQQADAAAGQATDFGQLFLGFSFFLLAAALLLAGLLFVLGVRHRSAEVGTLLALGFPPRRVRRLFLAEGAVVALAGAVAGTAGGLLYTRAMLAGLATVWSGAVASATVRFHVEPATLVLGAAAGVAVALLAIWIGVARQARLPARVLLSGEWQEGGGRPAARRWPWLAVAAAATIVAAAIILSLGARRDEGAASGFFGAGALLLVAAVAFCRLALDDARAARRTTRSRGGQSLTLSGLARRNSTRRIGRSLAAVALLACGTFLVVAIGANRQDANQDAGQRSSGTGGFALVGESAAPITRLEGMGGAGGSFQAVPLRVHEGDDASCLNLNRAQRPRVLGVRPEELARRGAFRFEEALPSRHGETSWDVLNGREEGVIPAVADETTITWALGRKVGDTIDLSDERGQTVRLRLVAALANSVLQGSLIISDADFLRLFPSDGGYRMFLIDAAAGGEASVATNLSRSYENSGLQVTPAARRLAAFNEVENAYLSIFQLLGGLGLLLGSAGLGVVVLRNVLERRGELAILRAVGFTRRTLRGLVLREHLLLLAMGLASGAAAGAVAVLPAIRFSGQVPWLSLGVTLAAIGASGALWVWLAAATALRGPLLPALRNE